MILVTGASGNVGKEVVRWLERCQVPFRIGARRPVQSATNAESVLFDFLDASTFTSAVAGCAAVFLLRPPAISNTKQSLNAFIDVARAQGVSQIVFISVANAGDNPLVPHHAVEQHLRAGPAGWTILRPGFFAQNIGDAYRDDIVADQRLFVPAGSGCVAFIDARDIAEVAVKALLEPFPHQGQIYTLTGPAALSFVEVAQILSTVLGRSIHYQPASIARYVTHLSRRGMPAMQILVETILHVGLRYGQAQAVTPLLPQLLGHAAHSVYEYVRDHRDVWQ